MLRHALVSPYLQVKCTCSLTICESDESLPLHLRDSSPWHDNIVSIYVTQYLVDMKSLILELYSFYMSCIHLGCHVWILEAH